jgi:hypothetical protein
MMSLALPFTCPRAVTSVPRAGTRSRGSCQQVVETRAHGARGGGFFVSHRERATTRRRESVLWHEVGFDERTCHRLPGLRAITRVESDGDDEEGVQGERVSPEADGSGEKKLKANQIQLPKVSRSAEMSFTCDVCKHRTTRRVNPHAYKNGTMFAQCAGCEAWHKIVDNLGLIYEFPDEDKEAA